MCKHTANPKAMTYISLFTREGVNFCDRTFICSLWGPKCDHTDNVVLPRMGLCNHSCRPMEWCGVVFLQKDKVSRLQVGGCLLPSLALLQALEVVG